ncbi:YncE family protein [Mycolicibacterium llatzerense]|uniref:YncE family protein n=1 Tax=Mycolicibacterium llatzerense TaxID=280871 RepID=UPI0013A6B38A|nr:YncE family protein [Mycolicibacterium llatzerense]
MRVSKDGKQLYVGVPANNSGTSGAIRVFDTTTGNFLTGAPLPAAPSAMVFNPDGTKLYVASSYGSNGFGAGSFLTVFDTATMSQVAVTTGSPFAGSATLPLDLVLGMAADNTHVYIAESSRFGGVNNSGQIVVFDTSTNSVATTIAINDAKRTQIAVSPDSSRVYVNLTHLPTSADYSAYTTSLGVIDTATNTLAGQPLALGPTSFGTFTLNPDGTRIYLSSPFISKVTVVDTGQAAPNTGGPTPQAPDAVTVADVVNAAAHALFEGAFNAIGSAVFDVETTAIKAVQITQALLTRVVLIPLGIVHAQPPTFAEPTTTQGLYERLRATTDNSTGIWIDKVTNDAGKISYVVYLGGTQFLDTDAQQNLANNVYGPLHVVKPSQRDAITNFINAPGGDPKAPIMLVGFSQGGMDAQNIAEQESQFNVTTVVLFAAPLVYATPSTRFKQIDLVAKGDPVPALSQSILNMQQSQGHVYGPATPSDYWQYTLAEEAVELLPLPEVTKVAIETKIGGDHHGDKQTYSSVGYLFDHGSGYQHIKDSIADFAGRVPAIGGGFA